MKIWADAIHKNEKNINIMQQTTVKSMKWKAYFSYIRIHILIIALKTNFLCYLLIRLLKKSYTSFWTYLAPADLPVHGNIL